MLTIRQIERLWTANDYARLASELLTGRVEMSPTTLVESSNRLACAALALVRIDEFGQNFNPLCPRLIRALLAGQNADGGWGSGGGEPVLTALAIRALSTSRGQGQAIERGLAFLTGLRKDDGSFPKLPIARTAADDRTTHLVLHHLSHVPAAMGRMLSQPATQPTSQAPLQSTPAGSPLRLVGERDGTKLPALPARKPVRTALAS